MTNQGQPLVIKIKDVDIYKEWDQIKSDFGV